MIAGPFFTLFGGGACVLASTVFAYLSEFATDTPTRFVQLGCTVRILLNLCYRTSYFSLMSSMSYVFALLGPFLASVMMSHNLYLPFYLGLALLVGALPTIRVLPRPALPSNLTAETIASNIEDDTEETPLTRAAISYPPPPKSPEASSSILQRIWLELREIAQLLTRRANMKWLLVAELILGMASTSIGILVLYISNRYNKTFAEVSIRVLYLNSTNYFL